VTGFQCVGNNLRESFRVLAADRPQARVEELPGVSIASLGVTFQMFNAAFLSGPVQTEAALYERLQTAAEFFATEGRRWSFWICEDWLAAGVVRRRLSKACESVSLRLSSELPGMMAESIDPPTRALPSPEYRNVDSEATLNDFRAVGASCFHVPVTWFGEVFNETLAADHPFVCWVCYLNGEPVATAATVFAEGAIGLYNVATAAAYRHRGYAEAITRHAIDAAARRAGCTRAVLQSTSEGLSLYRRIGFRPVTRILVYNSVP